MRNASLFLAAVLLSGCAITGTDDSSSIVVPTPPGYASAPDTVDYGGQAIVMGATLWRDFMPNAPMGGQPLAVVAGIRGTDPSVMTSGIQVLRLAVVRGSRTWAASIEPAPSIPENVAVTARGGPKWGPGETVDVVARIRFPDGTETLIAARGVAIRRTD